MAVFMGVAVALVAWLGAPELEQSESSGLGTSANFHQHELQMNKE